MVRLALVALLAASPALAQSKAARRVGGGDPCAPIGRTANGALVYSMRCESLPAPSPEAAAQSQLAPAEPEVQRGGIFGLSYVRKRPDE